MPSNFIEISNLTMSFGQRRLYENLSFNLGPKEFLAVLGPNGAGKTTLIKLLLGLLEPTSGSVKMLGTNPSRARSCIGYVPQLSAQEFTLPINVYEFVKLGLNGNKYGISVSANSNKKVNEVLELLNVQHLIKAKVSRLSGGEFQRVRIAQAIVNKPKILLFDEALLSLDIKHQGLIGHLLNYYQQVVESSVIFVAHDLNSIIPYVTKILYIANGNWAIGTPQEILNSETLSKLYGSEVNVVNLGGRTVVLASEEHISHITHGHELVN